MHKKPVKASPSLGATKPKPKTQPPPVVEEKIEVQSFAHSCADQQFALVWLDEDLDPNDQRCKSLVTALKKIVSKVDVFNDTASSVEFMKKIHRQQIYLIVSNPTEKIIGSVDRVSQVTAIFILDEKSVANDSWRAKWRKIAGIHTNIDQLCQSLKSFAKRSDEDYHEFVIVSSDELSRLDLNEMDPSFMYTQLAKEIILEMAYEHDSPQKLVAYCREHQDELQDVELIELDTVKNEYLKPAVTPIAWYTAETFLYKMANWALFRQKFDAMIQIAFFIKDVYTQLNGLYKAGNWATAVVPTLYRGQGMTLKELDQLKKKRGGLLALNSFMSTSTEPKVANKFIKMAMDNGKECAVQYEVTVGGSGGSAVFADIQKFSVYDEAEILFAFGTVFRIGDTKFLRKWSDGRKIWSVQLTLCDSTDENLHKLMNHIRQQINGPTALYRLGAFLLKVAQYQRAFEIFERALKLARNDQEKADIYYQVGFALYNQGNAIESLDWYQRALSSYQRTVGENHQNTASIYNNIALAYSDMKDYENSLRFYHKAREIYERVKPNDLVLATCYNNIASDYENIKDFQRAIDYYNKSLGIHDRQSVPNNPDRATLENNIGLLHLKLKQKKEAMERFRNAVKIGEKSLPTNHPHLVTYQKHLQTMQQDLTKYN